SCSGFAAALVCMCFSGLRASRWDLMQVLRTNGRAHYDRSSHALNRGIVIAEVALSFVLLIGSGLLLRSVVALAHVDPGYDPRDVLTFTLLGVRGNQPVERLASVREIQNGLRTLPGVADVSASSILPLGDDIIQATRWGTEEALTDPAKFQQADPKIVLPGYFETLRTKLIEGRTFTEDDNAPDRNLAIVDRDLAAKAFPNQSSVGKHILVRIGKPQTTRVEIIGVVEHQRSGSLARPGREQFYITDGLMGSGAATRWVV